MGATIDITIQEQSIFINSHFFNELPRMENGSEQTYLSKKEIECINWMIKGKSSYEMALILNISRRTVEAHMNNIKKKLNCYKQFQVGYLIGKYGHLLL